MKKIFVAATVGLLLSLTPAANAEVTPVKSDNAFVNQSNARDEAVEKEVERLRKQAEELERRIREARKHGEQPPSPKFDGIG